MRFLPLRASGCPGKVVLDNVPERFPCFGSSTGSSHWSLFNHCPQRPGLDRSPRSAYPFARNGAAQRLLSLVRTEQAHPLQGVWVPDDV